MSFLSSRDIARAQDIIPTALCTVHAALAKLARPETAQTGRVLKSDIEENVVNLIVPSDGLQTLGRVLVGVRALAALSRRSVLGLTVLPVLASRLPAPSRGLGCAGVGCPIPCAWARRRNLTMHGPLRGRKALDRGDKDAVALKGSKWAAVVKWLARQQVIAVKLDDEGCAEALRRLNAASPKVRATP